MIKAETLNMNGEKSDSIELNDKIFGIIFKNELIKQAVTVQLSNQRSGNANTKTRAEVSGGGKKPWRQKGTGNARAGSSRSPLWTHGGVTFGPRSDVNWSKKLSKKMRKNSILTALSCKITDKKLIVLSDLEFKNIKTKQAIQLLQKMPIEEGSILIIIAKSNINIQLSFRNLSYTKVLPVNCLNVYDILKYDWIIITKDAVKETERIYLRENVKETGRKASNLVVTRTVKAKTSKTDKIKKKE